MGRILRLVVLAAFAIVIQISSASGQTQVAAWTFDTTPAAPSTPNTIAANLGTGMLYANGTNGASTWTTATTGNELTAFGGATINDPRVTPSAGNALALVSSTANGKSVVIKFSMTGLKDPVLSYASRNTATGFNNQTWSWSTDGSSFTTIIPSVTDLTTTFAAKSFDLSSINSLDGAADVYLKITFTGASNVSGNNRLDNIVVNATTPAPPNFTVNFPKAQNANSTSFQGVVNLDKTGTAYCVVLPDGASAPSSAQVKAGKNALGGTLDANLTATVNVTSATTDFTFTIIDLTPSTDYDVYFVAENVDGIQAAPVKVDVATLSALDVTPPNYNASYPKVDAVSATSFVVRTNLDELGKTYFVVLASGAAAPSSTQIKNGVDANDITVAAGLKGTMNVTTSNTEFTTNVSGLSPETPYDIYIAAEDNVPNLQANPTKISVATGKLYAETFNDCNGTSSFSSYSVTGDQVWGCVDFGYNGTKGLRMNGFLGSAVNNEDWLISPVLTLNANSSLSFYSQFSFAGPGLQLKISSDYTGSGNPNSATWTSLNGNFPVVPVGSTSTSLADWTLSNVDLSAYTGNVYVAFVYTSTVGTNTAARWTLDEINVNNATASYFQATPSALSFKTSGVSMSYSLKGVNLQNGVTITAPTNFSVSKDNNSFSNSISFSAAEANAQPSVYVKFTAPGSTTDTYTGTITNVSPGVESKNVLVKGTDLSLTFDVATYNLEFFGTDVKDASNVEFGPLDDALQVTNVSTVLNTIGADIFGVEEIADDNAFNQLVANLPGYDKIVSPKWSYSFDPPDPNFPPQKVAFIYNTSTVQIVSSRVMFSKLYDDIRAGNETLPGYPTTSNSFWSSGRLPFMVTADVTINGLTKRIRIIDVHTKSGSAAADYNRRLYDVQVLHDSLTTNYPNDNIILVGDYNDLVEGSIYTGHPSTFKPFVDNTANYNVLTYNLSLSGASTFPSSSSFIDHVIISNDLASSYVTNSISVEDPRNYISNYSNTTSDHLPVVARFLLTKNDQTITFAQPAAKTYNDADFDLTATATSLLNVSFVSADPSIASVVGKTVTIHKAGTVNITASQTGNTSFNSAPDVVQPLVINKADQTIIFTGPLPAKTFGDAAFGLTATSTSLLTVTFTSSATTVATINNATVTIVGGGNTTITAQQAGDGNYNAAPGVPLVLSVSTANQTLTFGAIADKTIGDPAFSLGATASSNLAVAYSTTSDKITLNANQVTIVKAGRATITGSQAGNTNYSAATPVDQSFCIKPAKPTITISSANTATPILTSSATAGNQWYLNNAIIAGATNPTLSVTGIGVYKVQVKVDDCISTFSNDTPIIFTGDLNQVNSNIIVYPNPVTDYLEVRGIEREVTSAHVIDMMGRSSVLILEKNGETHRGLVDYLSTGMYILRVEDGVTAYQTKFIKK